MASRAVLLAQAAQMLTRHESCRASCLAASCCYFLLLQQRQLAAATSAKQAAEVFRASPQKKLPCLRHAAAAGLSPAGLSATTLLPSPWCSAVELLQ